MRTKVILLVALCMLACILAACSEITKEEAESKALDFVNERVKFISKESAENIDAPSIDSVTSYSEDDSWTVIIAVSATEDNETRKNDIVVKLDKKTGDVTEFNGQRVTGSQ